MIQLLTTFDLQMAWTTIS